MAESPANGPRWLTCGLLLVTLTLVGGCIAMDIRTSYGPGVDYNRFGSTFDWWPEAERKGGGARAANPTFDEFLRNTITSAFQARGYTLATAETPDFLIDYGVVRKTLGGLRHAQFSPVREEGSLVIDVLDGRTHKHVWRGYATAQIRESNPPTDQKRNATEGVRRILERFPKEGTQ
jgi:hypothetical protein